MVIFESVCTTFRIFILLCLIFIQQRFEKAHLQI